MCSQGMWHKLFVRTLKTLWRTELINRIFNCPIVKVDILIVWKSDGKKIPVHKNSLFPLKKDKIPNKSQIMTFDDYSICYSCDILYDLPYKTQIAAHQYVFKSENTVFLGIPRILPIYFSPFWPTTSKVLPPLWGLLILFRKSYRNFSNVTPKSGIKIRLYGIFLFRNLTMRTFCRKKVVSALGFECFYPSSSFYYEHSDDQRRSLYTVYHFFVQDQQL
jgi:hypothetical protein